MSETLWTSNCLFLSVSASLFLCLPVIARDIDGIDVRGFYVWKLQDHHAPDFGFFLSTRHQSRPKDSISIYRQLISKRGFTSISNPATLPCEPRVSRVECWLCENQSLLFFCVCIAISVSVLVGVMVTGVMKRTRRKRMKTRKRKMSQDMRRVVYRI